MAPRVPIAAPGGVLHKGRARGPHRWVLAAGRGGGALAHACELTSPRRLQLSGTAAGPPLGALVPCGERVVTRACKECPWLCKAPPSLPALAHALVHGDALARGWLCVQRGGGCRSLGGGFCTLPILFVKGDALARSRRHLCTGRCLHLHTRQSLSVRRHTPPCSLCKGTRSHAPPPPPLPAQEAAFAHSAHRCVCTLIFPRATSRRLHALQCKPPPGASLHSHPSHAHPCKLPPLPPCTRARLHAPCTLPCARSPPTPDPAPPSPPAPLTSSRRRTSRVAERTRELRLQRARHLLLGGRLPLGLAAPHGRVGGGGGGVRGGGRTTTNSGNKRGGSPKHGTKRGGAGPRSGGTTPSIGRRSGTAAPAPLLQEPRNRRRRRPDSRSSPPGSRHFCRADRKPLLNPASPLPPDPRAHWTASRDGRPSRPTGGGAGSPRR